MNTNQLIGTHKCGCLKEAYSLAADCHFCSTCQTFHVYLKVIGSWGDFGALIYNRNGVWYLDWQSEEEGGI